MEVVARGPAEVRSRRSDAQGDLLWGRRELLDHPDRRRLVELVAANPGVGPSELARLMGCRWNLVRYHLDLLARGRVLVLRQVGGRLAAVEPSSGMTDQVEAHALMRRANLRRLYERLRESPGGDQARLQADLGLSQPAVSRSLRRLLSAGLIRATWAEGRFRYEVQAAPKVTAPLLAV